MGESAVAGPLEQRDLNQEMARSIVRRLATPSNVRARLFTIEGELVADSSRLASAGRSVVQRELAAPVTSLSGRLQTAVLDWFEQILPGSRDLEPYRERADQRGRDYREVLAAYAGETGQAVRSAGKDGIVVSVAVPVQPFKKIVAALLLTTDGSDIEAGVRAERMNLLSMFLMAALMTFLLALMLASMIARPIRRLAAGAEQVGRGPSGRQQIPDFTGRNDEIGDLSGALREMTEALYQRLDAIEAFAADVAHEIKNPLTSLRSAVDTVSIAQDPEKRERLIQVIRDDVGRIDRLISDISDASRLDAELSRAESGAVNLVHLVNTVADVYRTTAKPNQPRLVVRIPPGTAVVIRGLEGRLGQVLRNLVDNAVSFSPPGGCIEVSLERQGTMAVLTVVDEGPGLPPKVLNKVFERFYSERPSGEAFGKHSGLGLSICRQIVTAHRGTIEAGNVVDSGGTIRGAIFTVRLPL